MPTHSFRAVRIDDTNSPKEVISYRLNSRNEVSVVGTIQQQVYSYVHICLFFLCPLHLNHLRGLLLGVPIGIRKGKLREQYGMGTKNPAS